MKNCESVFVAGVLLYLISNTNGNSIPEASRCHFPAIYNFGDSNSDTGAASAAFWPAPPPNGVTHFGRPSGRYSDGRLIIDFIAEHLRLPYLSAYLDSIGANFRHGASFATAGATIRRPNESVYENGISPFSMDIQAVQFDQFKARTVELHRRRGSQYDQSKLPRQKDFSRALYIFDIGQNDIVSGFRKLTLPQIKAAIPDIVDQLASAVTSLYQRGARTFWIHNTGPLGCLPATRIYFSSTDPTFVDGHGCIKDQNGVAIEFNKQLKARVSTLRSQFPRASIVYVDIYAAKRDLITHPKSHGFSEGMKICCGHHSEDVHVWCGQRETINGTEVVGEACALPEKYVSWDGVHYTEAANRWIANRILNGSYSEPALPISDACPMD